MDKRHKFVGLLLLAVAVLNVGVASIAFQTGTLRKGVVIIAVTIALIGALSLMKSKFEVLPLGFFTLAIFAAIVNGVARQADFQMLALDLSVATSIVLSFCLINYLDDERLNKLLHVLVLSAFLLFFVFFDPSQINAGSIARRQLTWTEIFYVSTSFSIAPFCLNYFLFFRKGGFLYLSYLGVYLVLAVMFLKRLELVYIFSTLLLYAYCARRPFINAIVIGCLILSVAYYGYAVLSDLESEVALVEYVSRLSDPLGEGGGARVSEVTALFEESDFLSLAVGYGFGVPHLFGERINFALHIGVFNLVYKFGILLAAFMLAYSMRIGLWAVSLLHANDTKAKFWASSYLSMLMIFITVGNFWDTTATLFFFVLSMLKVVHIKCYEFGSSYG